MARVGQRLQEVRLSKGLTLERISDETNISVKFLNGIENDNFSDFPGELYIVGFIRNYAEFLGLDPEEFQKIYKKAEPAPRKEPIPEGEAPAEETEPPPETVPEEGKKAAKRKPSLKIPKIGFKTGSESESAPESPAADKKAGADSGKATPNRKGSSERGRFATLLIALLLFLGILYAGVRLIGSGSASAAKSHGANEYRVDGTPYEKRLYPGDSLLVPSGDSILKVKLVSIKETANFQTPFGTLSLQVGEQKPLAPDANSGGNIELMASDFSKGNGGAGVLVKLDTSANMAAIANDTQVAAAPSQTPQTPAAATGQTPTTIPSSASPPTVLLRSPRGTYPFTAIIVFRGSCMFRYEADRREWVEKYYSKGESLTVNADSMLTLWSSNAQAVRVTIQISGGRTADFELGGPGEIAVKKISWVTDGGSWALAATNID